MKYWQKRIINQNEIIFNKEVLEIENELARAYRSALQDTKADLLALYAEIKEKQDLGTLTANDLYKYDRYYQLINNLNRNLVSLGRKELVIYEDYLNDYYQVVRDTLIKSAPQIFGVNFNINRTADKAVKQIWCADGQHWSDRIWKNKGLLQERLEKSMIDCFVRGKNSSEIAAQLSKDMGVGFHNADRIARTELANIQIQSSADAYQDAGLEYYEIITAKDDRVCEDDADMDGKVFPFAEMVIGVNAPPFHPNCRCDILPVINTK